VKQVGRMYYIYVCMLQTAKIKITNVTRHRHFDEAKSQNLVMFWNRNVVIDY